MPAAWFAIPIVLLSGWYATFIPSPGGYGTAATAAASGAMPLIGAFVGACAAWEGSRVRRADIWAGPWVRSRLQIATWLVALSVAVGLVAIAGAVAVAHIGASAFPPDVPIVGVMAVDILAYAGVGFALGVLAPPALGLPIATILPVLWLAFVPAMYPVWLRHLTGMYRDCCSLDQTIAPPVIAASMVMDLALIAASSIACVVAWPRFWRAAGVWTTLAIAGLVGAGLVSGLGFAPVMPRDTSLLTCVAKDRVNVCLWPEHAPAAIEVADVVADVHAKWLAADIAAPTAFTEASGAIPPGSSQMHPLDPTSRDSVILALANGLLPPAGDCGHATTGGIAIPYLTAWYAAAGGMSPGSLQGLDAEGDDINPSILTVVGQLTLADANTRRAWVAKATSIAQTCEEVTPDLRVGP